MNKISQVGFVISGVWVAMILPATPGFSEEPAYRFLQRNKTVTLCPTIGAQIAKCAKVEGGSNGQALYVVQSMRNAVGNKTYLRLRSETGEDGFADSLDPAIAEIKSDSADNARDCGDAVPAPQLGMTSAQVTATCWGTPSKIVTTSTLTRVQEDYLYSNGRAVRLVNGLVSLKIDQR